MRAYASVLPSGRWRGVIRPDGRKAISASFDYEYEAREFVAATLGRIAAADDVAAACTDTAPRAVEAPAAATAPARVASGRTLEAHAADWLERRRASVARPTADYYRRGVASIVESSFGRARVEAVQREDVERWLAELDDDGASPYTIRRAVKVLRMIYRDAVINRRALSDVTLGIRLPALGIRPARTLTLDEDRRVLAKADPQTAVFVLLALDAGLRWGEAAALPLAAVDLERGFVTVYQVIERSSGELRHYPKSKAPRVVPMTARLEAALRPLVAAARLRTRDDGAALIFVKPGGYQWRYEHWRDRWYALRSAAGLAAPQPRYHDLRHTYGTRLADAGVPRKEIAQLLGHGDEAMTARYIHAGDDGARQRAVRVALPY